MAINWKRLGSGLAWIVLSPLALLMAMISTVRSDTTYKVQLVAFGCWTVCGIVAGMGRIVGARWAVRLQAILCWIAFVVFAGPGLILTAYSLVSAVESFVLVISVLTFLTGIPFLLYARRLQRGIGR